MEGRLQDQRQNSCCQDQLAGGNRLENPRIFEFELELDCLLNCQIRQERGSH